MIRAGRDPPRFNQAGKCSSIAADADGCMKSHSDTHQDARVQPERKKEAPGREGVR